MNARSRYSLADRLSRIAQSLKQIINKIPVRIDWAMKQGLFFIYLYDQHKTPNIPHDGTRCSARQRASASLQNAPFDLGGRPRTGKCDDRRTRMTHSQVPFGYRSTLAIQLIPGQ